MIAATIIFTISKPHDGYWHALRGRAVAHAIEEHNTVQGLHSKVFILNRETGEHGGMYTFETQADLDAYLKSDHVVADTEEFGPPAVHVYEVPAVINIPE